MRTIVYMLKLIVVALGGAQSVSQVPGNTISAVLEQIRTAFTNKKDLPAATAADAGKPVVVGETGDYELGEAGGGALYVHISQVDGTEDYVSDVSYNEILTAISSGKSVVAVVSVGEETLYCAVANEAEESVIFRHTDMNDSKTQTVDLVETEVGIFEDSVSVNTETWNF